MSSLFEHWSNLTNKKVYMNFDDVDEVKSYSPYIINRVASMSQMLVPLAAEIDRCQNISKEDHYRFWYSVLPQTTFKAPYIKESKGDVFEKHRSLLMDFFECGSRDFDEIVKRLTEDDLKNILKMFGGRAGNAKV